MTCLGSLEGSKTWAHIDGIAGLGFWESPSREPRLGILTTWQRVARLLYHHADAVGDLDGGNRTGTREPGRLRPRVMLALSGVSSELRLAGSWHERQLPRF
jgi:hypothetical protein